MATTVGGVAMIEHGPTSLHFETWGSGPPVLLLAPGGLRASRIATWSAAPWSPIDALADRFTVIGMDQRNTGPSFAPITADDGWPSYAADQLAVMDHLGFERFGVVGMCIGGAFITELLTEAPARIAAAVAMQPIGLDGNRDAFRGIFEAWRAEVADAHPEAGDDDWEGCWTNLFGGDDVLFSAPDDDIGSVTAPILVLQGNDEYHPMSASRFLAETAPAATLIERWKDPDHAPAARGAVDEFLDVHLT